MMCYKDMTFCTHYKECAKGSDCFRALTPKVLEDAEKWMKNAPISEFVGKPDCFQEADNCPLDIQR